jgi:ABC-type nickel/cobalt efflux system permease component RcnA
VLLGLLVVSAAGEAHAHPAGVSSINRYLGVDRLRDGRVRLVYQLDFAELPAYAQLDRLDADHDGRVTPLERDAYLDALLPPIIAAWQIEVNGQRVTPRVMKRALEAPPGQGGLSTLNVLVSLEIERAFDPAHAVEVRVRDAMYADKPGFRELSASDSEACEVVSTSAPKVAVPLDYARTPAARAPRIDDASFTLRVRARPDTAAAPSVSPRRADATGDAGIERLAGMLRGARGGGLFWFGALLLAFSLGAGHALSPGHGKVLVGSYLAGGRSDWRHAVLLGVTVAVTHTAGIFVLGLLALGLETRFGTARLFRVLELNSGVLIVAVALVQLPARVRVALGVSGDGHGHGHAHGHEHAHEHEHAHAHEHEHGHAHGHAHAHAHGHGEIVRVGALRRGVRGVLLLGISGGLVPCPGALVVLLVAVATHRIALGLVLVAAFSLGLAGVLAGIGVAVVRARDVLWHWPKGHVLLRFGPLLSSLCVLGLGAAILLGAWVG